MPSINIEVPKTKFGLIEWRDSNDRPAENDQCLVVVGAAVLAARYHHGEFYLSNWTRAYTVRWWSPWPKAPIA
jgi:hypothetical protein